jgi:hypothetical protein
VVGIQDMLQKFTGFKDTANLKTNKSGFVPTSFWWMMWSSAKMSCWNSLQIGKNNPCQVAETIIGSNAGTAHPDWWSTVIRM